MGWWRGIYRGGGYEVDGVGLGWDGRCACVLGSVSIWRRAGYRQ